MNEQIILRKYQNSDHDALADIIRKAWHYDRFSGPKTAARMACVFLNSCLANQTFTQVATIGGQPVGIIMGKNIRTHRCPIKYGLTYFFSILSLLASKEGRTVSKIFDGVNGIDAQLLKGCAKKYQGEVSFFAVNSKYRGNGLGKKLFQSLLDYMKQEQIHDFFLFTDTSCTYQFYEHRGMIRRGEKGHTFRVANQTENMTFYIYDYRC